MLLDLSKYEGRLLHFWQRKCNKKQLHPGKLTWNLEITRLKMIIIWTKPSLLCFMLIFRGVHRVSQFLRLQDSFSFHFLVAVTHCFTVQEEGPNLNETTDHQKCYSSSFQRFSPYKMGRYQLQVGAHHFSCRCELTPVKPIEVCLFVGAPFPSIQDRQTGPTTCRNQLLNSTIHLMALPITFRMRNKNNLSFRFRNEKKAIERVGTFQFQTGPPTTYMYILYTYIDTCGIRYWVNNRCWFLKLKRVYCCMLCFLSV